MRKIRQSIQAERDIEEIWQYTARKYSVEQAEAYALLIARVIVELQKDPERALSRLHPSLGPGLRSYHIELSEKRSGTGIKHPRHVVFYTLHTKDEIYVLRILHDTMDPARHIDVDQPGGPER